MFAVEMLAPARVRVHDPAAVGDDGRRRRLLRVEEPAAARRPSCSRRSCSASRPGSGSAARSAAGCWRLRLRAQRRADRARAPGHPADGEHLLGDHVRDRASSACSSTASTSDSRSRSPTSWPSAARRSCRSRTPVPRWRHESHDRQRSRASCVLVSLRSSLMPCRAGAATVAPRRRRRPALKEAFAGASWWARR